MAIFKILGTTDAVNACDCCGKSNLKFTFEVDRDGETVHYGSTCVTKHTGRPLRVINKEIEAAIDAKKAAASKKFHAAPEYLAERAKIAEARRLNLRPGREFADHSRAEMLAAQAVQRAIAAEFGLEVWQVR